MYYDRPQRDAPAAKLSRAEQVRALRSEELAARRLGEAIGEVARAVELDDAHLPLLDVERDEIPAAVDVPGALRRREVHGHESRTAAVTVDVRRRVEHNADLGQQVAEMHRLRNSLR